jgi:hypothetical protein
MPRKTIKKPETGSLPLAVAALATLLLLSGCPFYDEVYSVYYHGNDQTSGNPPVDSRAYSSGTQAVVLGKSPDLKKGNLNFLGWQQMGYDTPLQPGDSIIVYSDVNLYAWWENDPDANPYNFVDDPSDRGVVITEYIPYNYPSIVNIPKELGGKAVLGIGEGVFSEVYLEAVTFPDGLEFIGNKAFAGIWLGTVKIPDTVKSIGKLAFQNNNLEDLDLGSSLESIGDYAFDNNRLEILYLPSQLKTLGEGAFADNPLKIIELGGGLAISNDTAFGAYGAAFRRYYADGGSRAGLYSYKGGSWTGPR